MASITTCYLDAENVKCDRCSVAEPSSGQIEVFDPHGSSLQFLTASKVDSIINISKIENSRILTLLRKLKTVCPVCFARNGQDKSHPLSRCPNVYGQCLSCQGLEQSSSSCPMKNWKPTASDACFKCFFPHEIGGRDFHKNSECPNDFVLPYAIALYRYKPENIEFTGTFQQYLH